MSSMTIQEKVARAIAWRDLTDKGRKECAWPDDYAESEVKEYCGIAATAIGVFLEAAAERGWRMAKDEATEEMVKAAEPAPDYWVENCYRAMLAAAPEFEWDK